MNRREFLRLSVLAATLGTPLPAAAASLQFKAARPGTVYSLTAASYAIRYRFYPAYNRPLIVAINGCQGNWRFTVNGRYIRVSAVDISVKAGDLITWFTV